jgi:hypothetical protein
MRRILIISATIAMLLAGCGSPSAPDSMLFVAEGTLEVPTRAPTRTPVPSLEPEIATSPTPTSPDMIFADGFESGSFSAWSSASAKSGSLRVSLAAAMVGTYGMQVRINGTQKAYVEDRILNPAARYRARFYFSPLGLKMSEHDKYTIFSAFSDTTSMLRVELRYKRGTYWLSTRALDGGGKWHSSGWFAVRNAPHAIELDWQAAVTGSKNGGLTFWLDGQQVDQRSGLRNDTFHVSSVRLGALGGLQPDATGVGYFDAFESRSETYIGP